MDCHSNMSTGQTSILKNIRKLSQQLDCNMGAGFGIGQGMMVTSQVITAGCGNRLQLMVRQTAAEMVTGGRKCIMELILGIIHPVHFENLFQTSFIEPAIMSHKRKSLNLRGYLFPATHKKSTGITRCPKIELTKHETGRSPLRADDDTGHIAMHVIIVQTVFGSVHVYFFRFSGVTGTDAPAGR